ncbi:response regulator with CheY-like receiver domain and winged-helix DNA-binding domain [Herbaspirillum sp. CF444]|uniref:response regulator n=1 Tax=Herbaspirillum sp. CF444 TaxID=1144319 RepID=UPI00027251DB|nr:response regulator [Herbaspirillum sp. CF444]EJL88403.1 response regulator with CheY-like receiver domain and winged-helix DNA-binding domain [Herbaspirillum sp. CF444]
MTTTLSAPEPLILVVDDSATSRVVIEKQLKKLGCNVTTAQDGMSGLAAMAKVEFDLVLLDCQMPDMSGYDVAMQVRKREREEESAHTPIVAISAETDAAHMQMCLDSGMDGVLGKPLPVDELKKILSLWCDVDVAASPATTVEEMSAADLQALFRSTSLEDFAAMQVLLAQADMRGIGRMAHRMKGAALTMGAATIVGTLERIEAIVIRNAAPASDLPAEIDMLKQQLQTI